MPAAYACATFFLRVAPDEIAKQYEDSVESANGYLTTLNGGCVLVDALATETADWGRQTRIAAELAGEDGVGISVFLVGEHWALAVAHAGVEGPVAAYEPEDEDVLEQLPRMLLAVEQTLANLFPGEVDRQEVDRLFGALLEGIIPAEEAVGAILDMLGFPADWLRWSWYETIPEQLFLDPDLASRVTPVGEARNFWEE